MPLSGPKDTRAAGALQRDDDRRAATVASRLAGRDQKESFMPQKKPITNPTPAGKPKPMEAKPGNVKKPSTTSSPKR
jgi:hypothetical protein